MDPQAPPVVAVVVTADPGDWLEEALQGLAAQDYPNLSVLVVDAGSLIDPTPRVASVLPTAYVRRLPAPVGYAAAANEAITVVEGAAFFLMCHDDVALDRDAVRLLVEEAFRSNAGVVCPKLVAWEDPTRLLQVGMGADKGGIPVPLAMPGELDQEQHDAVRDVFVAPGGASLIRADLFRALGGFDEAMVLLGEDLDFSWRAQVAGARVLVAPAARARHRAALSSGARRLQDIPGRPSGPHALLALRRRHELRAALKCYGRWHLLRVAPQLLGHSTLEAGAGLLTGHVATARAAGGAWAWNLRRLGDLRRARHALTERRAFPDSEVRRLQTGGSARLGALVEDLFSRASARVGQRAGYDHIPGRHGGPAPAPRDGAAAGVEEGEAGRRSWVGPATALVVLIVLLVGSRGLLGGGVPPVGGLMPFPGVTHLLASFAASTRPTGLGQATPAPLALALAGVLSAALVGSAGLAQTLLVAGMLPLGALGAYRLARPLGTSRARLAAAVVYLALPLPYADMAHGRWGGLVAYGAAPWVMAQLLEATNLAPFGGTGGSRKATTARRRMVRAGMGLAVAGAFAPAVVPAALLAAAGLVLGSLLTGSVGRAARALLVAVGAAAAAWLLAFPWSASLVAPGGQAGAVLGLPEAVFRAPGVGSLLGLHPDPGGSNWVGWAIVAAAAVPLVTGREWRVQWGFRLWGVALVCWGVAWAGGRGWLGAFTPDPGVLLAVAGTALALCAALGLLAFERDLGGYGFGLRQLASLAGAAGAVVGLLGALGHVGDGRWGIPPSDWRSVVAALPGHARQDGAYRILWVGDPQALPLGGWQVRRGLAYATSTGSALPDVTYGWPAPDPGGLGLAADVLRRVEADQTALAGRPLADLGIRYIVIPSGSAPGTGTPLPAPPALTAGLDRQLDLRPLSVDPSVRVYAVSAWRAGSGPGRPAPEGGWRAAQLLLEAALWLAAVLALAWGRLADRVPGGDQHPTGSGLLPPDDDGGPRAARGPAVVLPPGARREGP